MIIGIFGGSGSGKTTIQKMLSKEFSESNPSVFSLDNYYKPKEEQLKDDNGVYNFDLPTALDAERIEADFKTIIGGETINIPEYNFNIDPNNRRLITIEPPEMIIVEGLFINQFEAIKEHLDFTIFVDVDPKIQLDRRLYRDQESRGYDRDAILYQWDNHVMPCFNKYLYPFKDEADFIFHNVNNSEAEFVKLTLEIKKLIE